VVYTLTSLLFVEKNSNAGIIVVKCTYINSLQFILKRLELTLKCLINPMKFVRNQLRFSTCGAQKAHRWLHEENLHL